MEGVEHGPFDRAVPAFHPACQSYPQLKAASALLSFGFHYTRMNISDFRSVQNETNSHHSVQGDGL